MTDFPSPDSRAEVIESYAETLPAFSPAEIVQALDIAEPFHRQHMNAAIEAMAELCDSHPQLESLLALLITTSMTNDWKVRQLMAEGMVLCDSLHRNQAPAPAPKQEV